MRFLFLIFVTCIFAAESKLASNFIFTVMPSTGSGEFLAISRGEDDISTINRIKIKLSGNDLQTESINVFPFSKGYSLVHDLIFLDQTGKYRKSLWTYAGNTLFLPYYGILNGRYEKTEGITAFANGRFENHESPNDSLPIKIDIQNGQGVLLFTGNVEEEYSSLQNFPANTTVNSVADFGDKRFLAAQGKDNSLSYLLCTKNNKIENIPLPNGEYITSVAKFQINSEASGLLVGTHGNGILLSADTGKTWKPITNRTPVGRDLGSIRTIPSVLRGYGAKSLIAYQISNDAKITIEVFSYDMKLIRTIIKNAPRSKDPIRSSDMQEDVWDGRDNVGKFAAMGTYYVKVSDNKGHVGWGKIMSLGGNQ